MSKWIAVVALTAASIGLQVAVLSYGWNLTPASWWWILGGGIFGQSFIYGMRQEIEKEFKR